MSNCCEPACDHSPEVTDESMLHLSWLEHPWSPSGLIVTGIKIIRLCFFQPEGQGSVLNDAFVL